MRLTQSASITQLSNSITSKVSAGEIASTINQTAQSVLIDASKIKIGAFTYGNADPKGCLPNSLYCGGQIDVSKTATGISASNPDWAFWAGNGRFRVQQDGTLVAQEAKISGEFASGNWQLTSKGFKYLRNNTEYANMTYLDGPDFVDGGGSARIFYGTTNCDAQYGSDYTKTTYIRANAVKISAQNSADFDSCVSVSFDKAYGGNVICVYPSKGAGVLGIEGHEWMDIATSSLSADDYSGHSSRKVKDNIHNLEEVGCIIDKLTPVSFSYKRDVNHQKLFGLIYEDTLDVLPEICRINALAPAESDYRYGINYISLIPILLKEIQSLRKRVLTLENQKEMS